MPRHSPCALCSLTILLFRLSTQLGLASPRDISPHLSEYFMRSSFEIFEFFTRYEISLITLILLDLYDFSRRMSYRFPISLVCLAFLCSVFKVRFLSVFSGQWPVISDSSEFKLRFQHSLCKCWSLTSNFVLAIFDETRRGAPHVRRYLQDATTKL